MKLPTWLRKPDAPAPDLEAQLTAAKDALTASQTATQAAVDAFDAEPTLATEKALLAARDAERFAVEHVARAERLLTAAREREAAAHRAEQSARRDVLKSELTREAILAAVAPLAAKEAALLQQVCAVRLQRRELATDYQERAQELVVVLSALGEAPTREIRVVGGQAFTPGPGPDAHVDLTLSPAPVAELLASAAAGLSYDSPRRALLEALVPTAEAYQPRQSPFAMPEPRAARG